MNTKYIVIIIVIVLGLVFFLLKDQILNTAPDTVQPTPVVSTSVETNPTVFEATSATSTDEETVVTLTSSGFLPVSLTVKVGTKVTFINKTGTSATVDSDPHPVHTSYPSLNMGGFKDGETLTFTFDKAGTYGYHNHLKATQKGTIVVE